MEKTATNATDPNTEHHPWPDLPWPAWLPREPEWIKNMPGGAVTVGSVVVVALLILVVLLRWLWSMCCSCSKRRRQKLRRLSYLPKPSACSSDDLKDCIGPKLVVIIPNKHPGCACMGSLLQRETKLLDSLDHWLRNPKTGKHLTCVKVRDVNVSELQDKSVWAIGMTYDKVKVCAEKQGLMKVVSNETVLERVEKVSSESADVESPGDGFSFYSSIKDVREKVMKSNIQHGGMKYATWHRYSAKDHEMFKNHEKKDVFFTNFDVLKVLVDELAHARGSDGSPIFLAAKEVGLIVSMFPILDRPEDLQKSRGLFDEWQQCNLLRPPPAHYVAETFTPSIALYFTFMHSYARWLMLPAMLVASSFLYHAIKSKYAIEYGAAFNEGWSQASFTFMLSMWSTIFLASWRRNIHEMIAALGETPSNRDDSALSFAGSSLFFKSNGFKVAKGEGVMLSRRRVSSRNEFTRQLGMVFALMFIVAVSIAIVFVLCRISDKVSLWKYVEDPKLNWLNLLLQNFESVFVYLIVSIPLESVYDKLIRFLTKGEGHHSLATFTNRIVLCRAFFQLINYMGWFVYLGLMTHNWKGLRAQLVTFFLVKPSGLLGALLDVIPACCRRRDTDIHVNQPLSEIIGTEWKKDQPDIFSEYLEVMILFAAALLFAPVFPEGMVIAFMHTYMQYYSDGVKLQNKVRMPLPCKANLYELMGWIDVFEGIGWLGIIVSSWLVFVFLEGLGEQTEHQSHWDNHVKWDPTQNADNTTSGLLGPFLKSFPEGQRTVFMIVFLEHLLLIFKAYLAVSIPAESSALKHHNDSVRQVFREYAMTEAAKKAKEA